MALTEFELIDRYFTGIGCARPDAAAPAATAPYATAPDAVALGVGDDCALLEPPPGQQLALSVDTLVADVHFPAGGDPSAIAQRALRVNLSDLAAMGATPLAFTLALTLPAAEATWLEAFSAGLRDAADEFGIALVGGDTTRGPTAVITLQVLGLVPQGQALVRAGARPGDAVLVSGTLGDARAALAVLDLQPAQLDADRRHWLERYHRPSPRLALGAALRGLASAAIDVSDGLAADLGHILARSGVGASIDPARLPLSKALQAHPDAREFALRGGDDYELCFAAPPSALPAVWAAAAAAGVVVTEIVTITHEPGLRARGDDGADVLLAGDGGYRHF